MKDFDGIRRDSARRMLGAVSAVRAGSPEATAGSLHPRQRQIPAWPQASCAGHGNSEAAATKVQDLKSIPPPQPAALRPAWTMLTSSSSGFMHLGHLQGSTCLDLLRKETPRHAEHLRGSPHSTSFFSQPQTSDTTTFTPHGRGCNSRKHQNHHHMSTRQRPGPRNSAVDSTGGLEQASRGASQPPCPALG